MLCSSFFSVSKLQNHEKKRDFKKSLFCTPCSRRWSKINWDFVLLNNKTFFQLGTVFCQNMFLVVKIFLTSPSYTFYKQLLLSHELWFTDKNNIFPVLCKILMEFKCSSTTCICLRKENDTVRKTGNMCTRRRRIRFQNSQTWSWTLSFCSVWSSGLLL